MKPDHHLRAKQLLLKARIEGISTDDQRWLDGHWAECPSCTSEANALASMIQSLSSVPVTASADLVRRTSLLVHRRANELRRTRANAAPLSIAAILSGLWVIVTAPYVWSALEWLGRVVHAPYGTWQVSFLMWWFLPATVIAAVAVCRKTTVTANWG